MISEAAVDFTEFVLRSHHTFGKEFDHFFSVVLRAFKLLRQVLEERSTVVIRVSVNSVQVFEALEKVTSSLRRHRTHPRCLHTCSESLG